MFLHLFRNQYHIMVCCADVLGNMLRKTTAKRSRARVVDKLLSMGLVSERRQLYKKRSGGSGGPRKTAAKGSGKSSGKSSGNSMVRTFIVVLFVDVNSKMSERLSHVSI